jgi:hypothetical protein
VVPEKIPDEMNRSEYGYLPHPILGMRLSAGISKAARCRQKLIQMLDGGHLKIVLFIRAGMA